MSGDGSPNLLKLVHQVSQPSYILIGVMKMMDTYRR